MGLLRKILLFFMLIAAVLGILTPSFAAAYNSGTTAANFLKIGVGARAMAMGGAITAIIDDATALYWNPAGLAQTKDVEISATYNAHFQEIMQGYLSLAFPFLGGRVGLGANYVDMGKIEGRDEYGNPTGAFGASDIQVSLGYARKLFSGVMFGISAGMLRETIAEDEKSAYLGSAGLLLDSKLFSLGFVCQNIGRELGGDPLPLTYRGGIALKLGALRIEADVVKAIDDDNFHYCAGLEWWLGNVIALRAGYSGYTVGEPIGSDIRYGAGLKLDRLNINLDYAYVPYTDLGNTQIISLGIRF